MERRRPPRVSVGPCPEEASGAAVSRAGENPQVALLARAALHGAGVHGAVIPRLYCSYSELVYEYRLGSAGTKSRPAKNGTSPMIGRSERPM
jgi:hypothetical protein